MKKQIGPSGVTRIALYYRVLSSLTEEGVRYVSSEELGERTGNNAAQVRKDLSYFGNFGKPGVGYDLTDLQDKLSQILRKEDSRKMALVGVGNLGSALLSYDRFKEEGFQITAIFDNDRRKIGCQRGGLVIQDVTELKPILSKDGISIGIVTVPSAATQKVVDELIEVGVRAILNFAPSRVTVPDFIILQNVDLSIELDRLSFFLENKGSIPSRAK
ncbi:redox-sensing transcriptional repressor Rex [candidate division TA06 bacterium]|nr:redox-sensing transcriptional repressor Rex [candidate division TA06 bacterium]